MTRWNAVTIEKVLGITVCAGLLLILAVFSFAVKPSAQLQLGFMLLIAVNLGLVLVSPILVLSWWRQDKLRSLLPLAVAVVFLVLVFPAGAGGRVVRDWLFRSRLPRYEEVVRLIHEGKISVERDLGRVELPATYSELAVVTLAERDSSGTVTVEFLIGGGFPVKHTGYLFRSSGSLADWRHAWRWPKVRRVLDHWYAVSD